MRPSIKQRQLAKVLVSNPKVSIANALKQSGYSTSVQNKPSIVLKSKSFIELMNDCGLTDEYLNQKLKEGFESTKLLVHGSEVLEPPDNMARHKYLETALKVKGHLNQNTNVLVNSNDYKVFITED